MATVFKVGDQFNGSEFLGGDQRQQTSWKPLTGDDYLNSFQQMPAETKALIQGIANYELPPGSQRGGLGTPEVQRLLGMAKLYDPSFDVKNFKMRGEMLTDLTKGTTAQQLKNITNVSLHARDLQDAYDQMNLSTSTLVNWVQNGMADAMPFTQNMHDRQRQMGRTTDAINFLAPEAARLGMGGVPNEGDIKDVKSQYNLDTSPDVSSAGLMDIAHKAAQRLLGIQDQVKRAFGGGIPKQLRDQPLVNRDAAIALHDLLTRYKVEGADKLDWNVLTSGGFDPKAAANIRGNSFPTKPATQQQRVSPTNNGWTIQRVN